MPKIIVEGACLWILHLILKNFELLDIVIESNKKVNTTK